jgi:excisionase family DNA binding protein
VPPPRFLQLADVAEVLNISAAQVYALVRSGDLPAIKIGGRGQWRVESSQLEDYIARMYAETRDFVSTHPLGRTDDENAPESATENEQKVEEQPATTDPEAR